MSTEDTRVGCFQVLLLFLLAINCIIVAMSHALPVFHNYTPRFYCEIPNNQANRTYGCVEGNRVQNLTILVEEQEWKTCPTEYTFVTDYGEKSVVTDWGLICERKFWINIATIVYYVGVSVGGLIGGIVADRIGRLPVLAICLYSQGTMAVATYIVQSYPVFLGLRGLQGVFAQGLYTTTYILIIELFPTKFRTLIFTVMGVAWALGLLLLAILSYIISDWRILQLAVSVPTAITVFYIGIIPESPRWLLAKGKTTDADIALEKIEKYNACCCAGGRKMRKELVIDNSENTTPAKPERKSRVFSDTTKEITENEAANLLTPTNSGHRNSRRISLRVISENLEKRLSNLTPETMDTDSCDVNSGESSKSNRNSRALPDNSIADETKDVMESQDLTEMEVESIDKSAVESSEKVEDKDTEKFAEPMSSTRFKHLMMTKYGIVVAFQWFTTHLTTAIVLNSAPNLLNDRHINFAVGGIIELAIYTVIYFILSKYGRRLPLGIFQSLNSMICIMIAGLVFLPVLTAFWITQSMQNTARAILLLLARVTTTCTVGIIYLCTIEIFPTVLRGTCLGVTTIFGTIGYLTAPYITALEASVPMGHFMLAALLSLLGGLSCLSLPETATKVLPDTTKDVKRLAIVEKICNSNREDAAAEREILREKLFSEDWVDAGNGIIVNFTENKN